VTGRMLNPILLCAEQVEEEEEGTTTTTKNNKKNTKSKEAAARWAAEFYLNKKLLQNPLHDISVVESVAGM
jgi:hypothetical protein